MSNSEHDGCYKCGHVIWSDTEDLEKPLCFACTWEAVRACQGIKDPETTIPDLTKTASTFLDVLNTLYDGSDFISKDSLEDLIDSVRKVLKGVSDE